MDEDKTKQEPEKPDEDTGEGNEPAADEKVKQLNADTERINKAIAENDNAKARQKLSGTADAGQTEVVSEDQKKVNDAADYFKGSQLEKDIRKANELESK